jgi:hypothetical protein
VGIPVEFLCHQRLYCRHKFIRGNDQERPRAGHFMEWVFGGVRRCRRRLCQLAAAAGLWHLTQRAAALVAGADRSSRFWRDADVVAGGCLTPDEPIGAGISIAGLRRRGEHRRRQRTHDKRCAEPFTERLVPQIKCVHLPLPMMRSDGPYLKRSCASCRLCRSLSLRYGKRFMGSIMLGRRISRYCCLRETVAAFASTTSCKRSAAARANCWMLLLIATGTVPLF